MATAIIPDSELKDLDNIIFTAINSIKKSHKRPDTDSIFKIIQKYQEFDDLSIYFVEHRIGFMIEKGILSNKINRNKNSLYINNIYMTKSNSNASLITSITPTYNPTLFTPNSTLGVVDDENEEFDGFTVTAISNENISDTHPPCETDSHVFYETQRNVMKNEIRNEIINDVSNFLEKEMQFYRGEFSSKMDKMNESNLSLVSSLKEQIKNKDTAPDIMKAKK